MGPKGTRQAGVLRQTNPPAGYSEVHVMPNAPALLFTAFTGEWVCFRCQGGKAMSGPGGHTCTGTQADTAFDVRERRIMNMHACRVAAPWIGFSSYQFSIPFTFLTNYFSTLYPVL